MLVTRWTERKPHRFYLKGIADNPAEMWDEYEVDYKVAVHGKGGDDELKTMLKGVPTLDWRHLSDGKFPKMMRLCFIHAIEQGYENVSLVDDDGYYRNPQRFFEVVEKAF